MIAWRKRHILTGSDGRLFAVNVHGAKPRIETTAKALLARDRDRYLFVQRASADGGYASHIFDKISIF